MATLDELERAAEAANGLPSGTLSSIRQQETGGSPKYVNDPSTYHYPLSADGRRIAGHTGKVSTAFGPYGILESTAAQPGYGVQPLRSKDLADQVDFAASYLSGRARQAGSLEAGLAGYGEGNKYANQVLKRINNMATPGTTIDTLAAQNTQRNDVAAAALEQASAAVSGAYKQAQQALVGYGEDSALVVQTKALAEADARGKAQQFAAKIGTDPNAASYALNKLVDQSAALFEREQRLGEQVARQASTEGKSFFGALFDRALLPQMVREYNTVSTMRQATDQRIGTLNQLTQTTAVTQNAISQSVTTESAAAMARMAQSEVAQKIAGLQIDSIKQNSAAILQVTQLRNSGMDIALKQRDQQLQEQGIAISRQNAALSASNMMMQLQERSDRVADKAEHKQAQVNMLNAINVGRQINGNLPAIRSVEELTTMAKMSPEMEKQFQQQYISGITAAQTGRATVAETPWDAAKYKIGTGARFEDGRAKVFEFIDKMIGNVQADPKIPAADKTKEKVVSSAVNQLAMSTAANFQRDITSGGSDNIYRAPPTSVYLKDPEFAKSYMAQKILTPMQAGGMENMPIKEAVNTLLDHMTSGKISAEQVNSELGFFAAKTMGYNNELYRYKDTAGIPNMSAVGVRLDDSSSATNFVNAIAGPGTPGHSNPVTRSLYSVMGGTDEKIVNLADPTERADFINRRQAQLIPPVLRQQAIVQQSKSGKTGGQ